MLRVFENGILRKIFVNKKKEVTRDWENCIMTNLIICDTLHKMLPGWAGQVFRMGESRKA